MATGTAPPELDVFVSVVDSKSLGKPDKFDGSEKAWATWSFTLISWLEFVSASLVTSMGTAGEQRSEIDFEMLSKENQHFARQLYAILALLLKGAALKYLMWFKKPVADWKFGAASCRSMNLTSAADTSGHFQRS